MRDKLIKLLLASDIKDKYDAADKADEILDLFNVSDSFISVSEQEPPHNVELLAKSPAGSVHICSWRPACNIFSCQEKSESSWDWSWKFI